MTPKQRVVHFLNRASFGPTRATVERVTQVDIRAYPDEQLRPSGIPDALAEAKIAGLKTLRVTSRGRHCTFPLDPVS